ncbi:hypothetical protein OESDEN_03348 [Oesophagostomum dentatum]|uniref:Uncharacterized protein n=1 Tax=Oesophagostomum dentatum TaxID=61180 RepID=A0A0B1TGP1_OESDE|nr:hypothetical protein OESDEN_03348 [Oesophagostomum dentatum]
MKRTLSIAFLVILILGVAVAVILTVVLTAKGNTKGKAEKVMFFAFYSGDESPSSGTLVRALRRKRDGDGTACSLELDISNTRDSITAMKNVDQEYSYILYTDVAQTHGPFKALDALTQLNSITANPSDHGLSQSSVMREFIKQANGNPEDQLVFYMPCSYVYSDDNDQAQFVQLMKDANMGDKTLIVSSKFNSTTISNWYGVTNVAGAGSSVVNATVTFGEETV